MRVFIAVLFFILPILAHGANCPAGQYLNNGECTNCNENAEAVYCPGDDMRYDCPKTNTDYNALAYPNVVYKVIEAAWANAPSSNSIYTCRSDIHYKTPDGDIYLIECPYNGENYYCNNYRKYWQGAGVGRYLSDYFRDRNYNTTKPCTNAPINAHYTGPGTPDAIDGSYSDKNDCPWACDDGYGLHEGACLPLCTAGATKFHVGDFVFNIYKEKLTTPAINIGSSDGKVCYVPLMEGNGKNALNVDYHGVIYHTSD